MGKKINKVISFHH